MPIGTYSSFPYQYRRPRLAPLPASPKRRRTLRELVRIVFRPPNVPHSRDRRPRLSARTTLLPSEIPLLCGQTRASVPTLWHHILTSPR